MVKESIAILIIAVLLVFVFLRSRHYGYALAAAPVGMLPAVHLAVCLILAFSKGVFFGIRPAVVVAFADVLGLALSCAATVLIGQRIPSRRNRGIYLGVLLLYVLLLAWVFIYTALRPLLLL